MRFSRDIQRCSPVERQVSVAPLHWWSEWRPRSCWWIQIHRTWSVDPGNFSSWLVDDFFIGSGVIRSKIYWGSWNTPLGETRSTGDVKAYKKCGMHFAFYYENVELNHWVASDGFGWNFELHHFCHIPERDESRCFDFGPPSWNHTNDGLWQVGDVIGVVWMLCLCMRVLGWKAGGLTTKV